jgi:hypothetical protein
LAGIKQHHVWQILQRGFGEKLGKDHHIWVYRKGKPAEKTVTRLFGFEKRFYGEEGSQADVNITKYESDNQSTIQEIRKLRNGADVDPEFAATLISHLEIRTSFLRDSFSTMTQKIVGGLVDRFMSPETLRSMMLAYLKDNPDELDKLLGKAFILPAQRSDFSQIAYQIVENMSDEEILKSMEHGLGQIGEITTKLPKIAKDGQNKLLAREVSNQSRSELHFDRKYFVYRPEDGSLILPDTTLAFVKKEGASPLSQYQDSIEAVILPIASNAAIIGTVNGKFNYPLKAINRILAGCSFEAFLALEQSASLQGMTGRIGKYAKLLKDSEINSLVRK